MKIINTARQNIKKHQLLSWGNKVLIAVSGGPDSVALLHILRQISHEWGVTLYVAHVDHHLRRDSQKDAKFVANLCQDLKIPFFLISIRDIRSNPGSLEEVARNKRYQALIKLSKKKGISSIAVAHTQDDLAETVLMRILRGTGLLGLQGIAPKRSFDGINIVRPLLNIKRDELMFFLKKNKIDYRLDPTNRQKQFFRNKVRLELLPVLKREYNPKIKESLSNLADITCLDYDFLEQTARQSFEKIAHTENRNRIIMKITALNQLHPSQIRMLARLAVETLQGDTRRLTLKHLTEIEDLLLTRPAKSIVALPKGIKIEKTTTHLIFKICP